MISLVSAMVSCVLIYAVYVLQLKQIDLQKSTRVVVPSQFIDAGRMITADMVEYKSIWLASYDERMFESAADVIGKEAAIALGKAEPILDWKLNKFSLMPGEKQATFQIPKEYILSISNGIRAGDRVLLYLSGEEAAVGSKKLFEEEVVVASVKTASNTEVDDLQHPSLISKLSDDAEQLYTSRRNANAMIDHINLNLTEEQWLTIDRLCRPGQTKLVIAFIPAQNERYVDEKEEETG